MSKQDGKCYVILYRLGNHQFHQPYVYKTLDGVIEQALKLKQDWVYKSVRVQVISKHNGPDDGEYYVVDDAAGATLVPVTEETRLIYE